jgi:7-cyano-7-deazaguanine synthase in queuosine biosynthesis
MYQKLKHIIIHTVQSIETISLEQFLPARNTVLCIIASVCVKNALRTVVFLSLKNTNRGRPNQVTWRASRA